MKKKYFIPVLALLSIVSIGIMTGCNDGGDTPTPTPPDPTPIVQKFELDKTEVTLSALGESTTVNATVENIDGTVSWESTDEENISILPSNDGKSCVITNVKGGNAVVTAKIGNKEIDVTVKASTFGDLRKEYVLYDKDGTALEGTVKGFWNAIQKLSEKENCLGGTIKEKDGTEVLYRRGGEWASAIEKDKTSDELTGIGSWQEDGKTSWYPNYQLDVDVKTRTSVVFTQESDTKSSAYNMVDSRPTDFSSSLFLDKTSGYNGDPTKNLWCGWRAAKYGAAITGAQYVSWADSTEYNWESESLTFDLSKSTMQPSLNADQSVFGQIYIGTSTTMHTIAGVYFDAGTIDGNSSLANGAEKDIYTFKEELLVDSGLTRSSWGNRTIGTTSIGKAKWDSFNKVWTFPGVKVAVKHTVKYTGEDTSNPEANLIRYFEVTGYKDGTEFNHVNYSADYGSKLARGEGVDRLIYGVTFTPNYKAGELPDITCGGKWSNVVQTESVAHFIESAGKEDQNIQFVIGRSKNGGNQTGLYGSDCMTMQADADENTVYNFEY